MEGQAERIDRAKGIFLNESMKGAGIGLAWGLPALLALHYKVPQFASLPLNIKAGLLVSIVVANATVRGENATLEHTRKQGPVN